MGIGEKWKAQGKEPVSAKKDNASAPGEQREEFCKILQTVDYAHSRIPPEILQQKSKPDRACGDLEYAAQWVVYEMNRLPEADKSHIPHIAVFDKALRFILIRFRESIEYGYINGAFRAREAMVKGVKIRISLPAKGTQTLQEDEFQRYMQVCCTYLADYGALIDQSIAMDVEKESLKRVESQYMSLKAEIDAILDETEARVFSDPQVQRDYAAVATAVSTSQLSMPQMQILHESIELGIKRTVCELRERIWRNAKIQMAQMKGKVDIVATRLERMPVLDYSNKIQSQIQDMFHEFVKSDRLIEEQQAHFDQIRGQIEAMENLPGQKAYQEYMEQSVARIHDELRELKQRENKNAASHVETERSLLFNGAE